jgi:hypothetical protein
MRLPSSYTPRKWLTWYFEQCAAAGGKVPENIQLFLPWNLSEEQKKELRNGTEITSRFHTG